MRLSLLAGEIWASWDFSFPICKVGTIPLPVDFTLAQELDTSF